MSVSSFFHAAQSSPVLRREVPSTPPRTATASPRATPTPGKGAREAHAHKEDGFQSLAPEARDVVGGSKQPAGREPDLAPRLPWAPVATSTPTPSLGALQRRHPATVPAGLHMAALQALGLAPGSGRSLLDDIGPRALLALGIPLDSPSRR